MKHFSALLLSAASFLSATAQYCEPAFANGCFGWNNQSVIAGDIDFAFDGVDCSDFDQTDLSTTVNAGEALPMEVTNGAWCGCAVWVDLDQSGTFEDSENLHYEYVGGAPSYTYSFDITIPEGTFPGAYRMRVIAPWGSDGFLTTNTNGYGPCGDFQYGNFNDFTINVAGTDGIAEANTLENELTAAPVPAGTSVALSTTDGARIQSVQLIGSDGRVADVVSATGAAARLELDLSALNQGVYAAICRTSNGVRAVRIVKD